MSEIIINGVDVSGCKYLFDDDNLCRLSRCQCYDDEEYFTKCKGIKNCYYKQLKRKEKECKELKEKLKILDDSVITYELTESDLKKI